MNKPKLDELLYFITNYETYKLKYYYNMIATDALYLEYTNRYLMKGEACDITFYDYVNVALDHESVRWKSVSVIKAYKVYREFLSVKSSLKLTGEYLISVIRRKLKIVGCK